jgi:PST family polysaccharide transporter
LSINLLGKRNWASKDRVTFVISLYFPALANLLAVPLTLSKIGLEAFGQLSYYLVICAIIPAIGGLGLAESAVFHCGRWLGDKNTMNPLPAINILALIQTGLVSLLVLGISANLSPNNLKDTQAISLTCITTALISISNVWRSTCTGLSLLRTVSLERLLSSIFKITAIAFMFGFDSISIISILEVQTIASALSAITLLLALCLNCGIRELVWPTTGGIVRSILKYSMSQAPASIVGPLLSRLDQFILGHLSSAEALGTYSTSVSASEGLTLSTGGFRDLTSAQQAQELQLLKIRHNSKLALLTSLIMLVIALIATAIAWDQLDSSGYSAVITPFLILLSASAIGAPGSIAGAVLMGRGKPMLRSVSLFLGLATDVILLLWLAPSGAALGAAIATAISGMSAGALNIAFCKSKLGLEWSDFFPSWRAHLEHA